MLISVIVPFYYGNRYLKRLMESINEVTTEISHIADIEVIIINDSPDEPIQFPIIAVRNTYVYNNDKNCGIQQSRINGLEKANGEWVIFLDQDDELISDGFKTQIELSKNADVVVGNGFYHMGLVNHMIYKNISVMNYLIQKDRFIEIRNLIPSPGECLIRKEAITTQWKDNVLQRNGADDWFLWLTLFSSGAIFKVNEKCVYRHNDSEGMNLSADLAKMRESSLEMAEILEKEEILSVSEATKLKKAIEFKYCQDSHRLTVGNVFHFIQPIWMNICYKARLLLS